MTLHRSLFIVCVAVVAIAGYEWSKPSDGGVVVKFERWDFDETAVRPVISIDNRTGREMYTFGVESGSDSAGRDLSLTDAEARNSPFLGVPPGQRRKCTVSLDVRFTGNAPIVITLVPWSDEQYFDAFERSKNWPSFIQKWYMKTYEDRPEHRHRVDLPELSEKLE